MAINKFDDISSLFNSVDTAFTLQTNSTNVVLPADRDLDIKVGGVSLYENTDFTITGSVINFNTAPLQGDLFAGEFIDLNSYTNTKIAELIGSAPETLDTLSELAAALENNENFSTSITEELNLKANITELDTTNSNVDDNTADIINLENKVGQELNTNSNVTFSDISADQIDLGDNEKIRLGASQDLQIFHNGSNSVIKDGGTGHLYLQGSNLFLTDSAGYNFIGCVDNGTAGTVTLYHNNAAKLATTSTGIDVTGTVVSNGLTTNGASEGDTYFTGGTANSRLLNVFTSTAGSSANAGHNFKIASGEGEFIFGNNTTANVLKIKSTGIDVTGNVGIGTSSPSHKLDVTGSARLLSSSPQLLLQDSDGTNQFTQIIQSGGAVYLDLRNNTSNGQLIVRGKANGSATEFARIDSSGRLLIGKTAVDNATVGIRFDGASGFASIARDGGEPLYLNRKTSDGNILKFAKNDTLVGSIGVDNADNLVIEGDSSHSGLQFASATILPHKNGAAINNNISLGNNTYKFSNLHLGGNANIDGNVGIGTSSPSTTLELSNASTAPKLRLSNESNAVAAGGDLGVIEFYSGDNSNSGDSVQASLSVIQPTTDNVSGEFVFKTSNALESSGALTERVRISKDGNVGIGTSSPVDALDVNGKIRTNDRILSNWYQSTSTYGLQFSNSAGAIQVFKSDDGKLGIGTTSPSEKLHISSASPVIRLEDTTDPQTSGGSIGKIEFYGNDGSSGGAGVRSYLQTVSTNASGNDHALAIGLSGSNAAPTEKIRLTNTGLGIGTTSPSAKLDTQLSTDVASSLMNSNSVNDVNIIRAGYGENAGTTSNTGAKWGLRFLGRTDGTTNNQKSAAIYGVSEDSLGFNRKVGLAFHTSPHDATHTERMRIDSSGNLCLGNTGASAKLDIRQDSGTAIRCEDGSGGYFVVQHGGNVGIGTSSPSSNLHVVGSNGTVRIDNASSTKSFSLTVMDSNNRFRIVDNTSSSERLTITNGGNVGIGTSSPNEKLEVDGNIKTSDGIILTSPNGTEYKLTVNDDGSLNTTAV